MNAVALLGTNLNEEQAYEIQRQKFQVTYLALDADAIKQQTALAIRHRGTLKLMPLILNKDLKDHTPQELEEFFHDRL